MTNRKSTKRVLLMSVLSLLLCFSMLVGTTFAWFTDSVTSANNIIKSGTLEIGMYWAKGTEQVPELNPENTAWTNAESGAMFTEEQLWEPGYVDVKHIMIANQGTLALKYALRIVANGEVSILADVIDVYFVDPAVQVVDRTQLTEENKLGTLSQVLTGLENGKFGTGKLDAGKAVAVTLALKMQEDAGNDYQNKSIGTSFSIKLLATQATSESDSFNDQYDAGATTYEPWDGTTDTAWYTGDKTEYTLVSAEQLAGLSELVNAGTSFSGKTVKLGIDVDLQNKEWAPIGDCTSGKYFQGTFDGQGYTIAGLKVDKSTDTNQHSTAGLFGWVDAAGAVIRNVTVDGATVEGSHWVGVIAGYTTGRVEGCVVTNSTVIGYHVNDDADGDKIGGIVGCLNEHSYVNNNTVSNCTITGNRDIGGIAGSVAKSTYEMKNNKVIDTTISYITAKDYGSAGLIVSGRTGYVADETNVATDSVVKKIGDMVVVNSAEELLALSATALTSNNNVVEEAVIVINSDIDMKGADFSAIIAQRGDKLTVIGNNHTISNVNIVSGEEDNSTGQSSMFYAYEDSTLTISNLTLSNVTSTSDKVDSGYAAAVIGYCEGTAILNNVDVVNATVTGAKSSGLLVGHLSGSLTATNCDVSGSVTITEYEEGGHYAGKYIGTLAGSATLTSCTVEATIDGSLNANNVGDVYGRNIGTLTEN